jgi:hypothetical protein
MAGEVTWARVMVTARAQRFVALRRSVVAADPSVIKDGLVGLKEGVG